MKSYIIEVLIAAGIFLTANAVFGIEVLVERHQVEAVVAMPAESRADSDVQPGSVPDRHCRNADSRETGTIAAHHANDRSLCDAGY